MPETILRPAVAVTAPVSAPVPSGGRLVFIDSIRGFAVALMALDHVREYFHSQTPLFEPTDLTQSTPEIFLTRWVTHLCAPLFILLAGLGAAFSMRRRDDPAEMARFLRARGAWLIFIELTVVKFGWTFNFSYATFTAQVIWAIGWSMIALSFVVGVRRETVLKGAIGVLFGYALALQIPSSRFGHFLPLWEALISGGIFHLGTLSKVSMKYPVVPWAALMAVGFGLGPLYERPRARRRRLLMWSGLVVTAAFVGIRWVETGGWHSWFAANHGNWDILWLLDAGKYPPSLTFMLMTVGPSLLFLSAMDTGDGGHGGALATFGRVPFFFYIVHLPVIHAAAIVAERLSRPTVPIFPQPDWKVSLAGVCGIWLAVLVVLYPACRWFADLKHRRREAWLSFL